MKPVKVAGGYILQRDNGGTLRLDSGSAVMFQTISAAIDFAKTHGYSVDRKPQCTPCQMYGEIWAIDPHNSTRWLGLDGKPRADHEPFGCFRCKQDATAFAEKHGYEVVA